MGRTNHPADASVKPLRFARTSLARTSPAAPHMSRRCSSAALRSAVLVVVLAGGCNGISGADKLSIDDAGVNATGGGSTATATTTTTTGGGTAPCVYPAGPYGVAQGHTVPPTLSWQVYAPNSDTPSTLKMEDLFDCDGTHGRDVVIVDTSQFG